MTSIFRTIFVRFLVMLVLSFIGTFVTRSVITRSPGLDAALLESQKQHALDLYRARGPEEMASFLARLSSAQRADVYLLNSGGRDLVDGTERSVLLHQGDSGFQIPYLGRTAQTRVISSGDKQYSMVIRTRRQFNFREFASYYVWTFASILVLSWWLAIDLGSPLRKLRLAVDEFGAGNLSSRARTTRNDEIGKLAASFDNMADRIENLLTSERRLMQDVSHELRSPLARLSCAIEIARNRGHNDETIQRIHNESYRLNALVNQLLEVVSAEGDSSTLRSGPIILNDLIRTLADDCQIEADAKRCTIVLSEDTDVEIDGDFELLRRGCENVLRNAIRYAPENSSIEVTLKTIDGHARLRVRDHGHGVPEELLAEIFKPFFRVESHRGAEGVGLGLALTERAIHLHHGNVSARNASPGLEVTIDIPLKPRPSSDSTAASPVSGSV